MLRLTFLLLFLFSNGICNCLAETYKQQQLSLQESILLAVRKNPHIKISQLQSVLEKFHLEVQKWEFSPHYTIQATHKTLRTYSVTNEGQVTSNASGAEAIASLLTPIGTKIEIASVNNVTDHYNPGLSLQIIQPLLKGFGRPVVEAELSNAIDNEKISQLNVQGELQNTITEVINAYLNVISAKDALEVDRQDLSYAESSLKKTEEFIKAGHQAGSEMIPIKASIGNIRTRIASDQNNIEQARYELLISIGIDPDSNVSFSDVNMKHLLEKYHMPGLVEAKEHVLAHDIQYQIAKILLQGSAKRAIVIAKDNTRWQLDLVLDADVGNSAGGGKNAGLHSLVNGVNVVNAATLNLRIPIDDRAAKNEYASSLIAMQQAEIALQQQKWSIQRNAIAAWKNIENDKSVLQYAEDAAQLEAETYKLTSQKYAFGLIDSLELNGVRREWMAAQRECIANRISYLKDLANLDNLMGNTLKTWNVEIK